MDTRSSGWCCAPRRRRYTSFDTLKVGVITLSTNRLNRRPVVRPVHPAGMCHAAAPTATGEEVKRLHNSRGRQWIPVCCWFARREQVRMSARMDTKL